MKGAARPADLDHRRQGPHPVRGRRGRDPHPRGSRPGRQHHRRRDLRREPRRHHPRLGRGDRHRPGRDRCSGRRRRREARIAELTQKLRADQLRAEQQQPRCAPERARAAHAGAPRRQRRAAPQPTQAAIEAAAQAAVAAAVLPMTDRGRHDPADPAEAVAVPGADRRRRAEQPPAPRAFIPPAPERAANRPPRMPRIDELPLPAQTELRAKRGEPRRPDHPEKREVACCSGSPPSASAAATTRRSRRMPPATSGRSGRMPRRRPSAQRHGRPWPPAPGPSGAAAAPGHAGAGMPRGPEPVSEYAKRPAHQGLDPLGRQAPVHNSRGGRSARHPGLPAPAGELTSSSLAAAVPAQIAGAAAPASPSALLGIRR